MHHRDQDSLPGQGEFLIPTSYHPIVPANTAKASRYRTTSRRCFCIGVASLLILFVLTVSFVEERVDEHLFSKPTHSDVKEKEQHAGVVHSHQGDKILSAEELLKKLNTSLLHLRSSMEIEYGTKYRDDLFSQTSLEKIFDISPQSKQSITRKLSVKLLQSLLNEKEDNVTLTWVTAGHSSAAGHGNLLNQTYTSYLESTIRQTFWDVGGIEFRGVGRAMGAYGSGPELALCMESVYGPDVDFLSWDFGMTDGMDFEKLNMWCHRATGSYDDPPVLFAMDGTRRQRRDIVRKVTEDWGLGGVSMMQTGVQSVIKEFVPTYGDGDVDEEGMGDALKYLVCGKEMENGGLCRDHKYDTKGVCEAPLKYEAGWHPGWKSHMLTGRLIGILLLQFLHDSITSFLPTNTNTPTSTEPTPTISKSYLSHLISLQQFSKAKSKTLPFPTKPKYTFNIPNDKDLSLTQALYKNKSFCHTALLPSHSRYNNIVHNSKIHPPVGSDGDLDYDGGYEYDYISESQHSARSNLNETFLMAWDPVYRKIKCEKSPLTPIQRDFKDYFLISAKNGGSITLPTDAELAAYGQIPEESSTAMVVVCLRQCPWNRCPADYIDLKDSKVIEDGEVTIHINGKKVTHIQTNGYCLLLGGEPKLSQDDVVYDWDVHSKTNKIHITFDVKKPGYFIYISSLISIFL